MPFSLLGLSPALAKAASELGFSAPTAIQTEAIPLVLAGKDILATAQTGSGKTAAFALPLVHNVILSIQKSNAHSPRRTRALILVPTRELAAQVGEVLRRIAQALPQSLKVAVVFGGVSINPQMMHLRGGADVVVATPGRLLDLVRVNALKLSTIETLVLDEADRLLDMGFAQELTQLLALLPVKRHNVFFSATFPDDVQQLAHQLLLDPVRIQVQAPAHSEAAISQRVIAVDAKQRTQLLRHLIKENAWDRVLVFVATQYGAEMVAEKLYRAGIYASRLHGSMTQGARTQVLQEFKNGQWEVLVTTDLASRGIDIAHMRIVVNYDLPRSAVDYVHRIGRTGRAGESGEALSFVSAETEAHFQLIEKRQGLCLPREQLAGFEPHDIAVSINTSASIEKTPPDTGGIKGKRPSKKDKLRAAALTAKPIG